MNDTAPPKPFAIYFPQFYPTPTNDKAWGQGFTDWSLVAQANLRPSWSRRAPAIGYYDGSSSTIHQRQFEQMRAYGLGGMGVYHYWFQQGQELAAFESTLLSPAGTNAPPWFLIWATENWSRRWIGDATSILKMSDSPSRAEISRHCEHLVRCFQQPNYWRWEGKPVFVWYNLAHFKAPEQVLDAYREQLASMGSSVAFGHFIKNPFDLDYASLVDFSYFFEPRLFFGTRVKGRGSSAKSVLNLIKATLGERVLSRALVWLDRFQRVGTTYNASDFLDYLSSEKRSAMRDGLTGPTQDVLSPGWNNTPRYGERFTALSELDPDAFAACVSRSRKQSSLPVLVNAWNEWSEGAAIEPCAYFEDRYLKAMGRALQVP